MAVVGYGCGGYGWAGAAQQLLLDAMIKNALIDSIPSSAREVTYDRPLGISQTIKKARFTNIRPTKYRDT